ncbi:maltose phosphorylase [Salmonella enterica subsp. arizonae]|nr:maltose phosphorylase [Salmonella enterica subsp. arizonae]
MHLEPTLPEVWSELSFPLQWQGVELFITISAESIQVSSTRAVEMWICGQPTTIDGEQCFSRRNVILPVIGTATMEGE